MNLEEIDSDFEAATHGAALCDVSLSGRINVVGADRLGLLHRLSTNDLIHLQPGDVTSTVFVTDKGRLIDHVIMVVDESSLLLITSPGNESTLIRWIGKYTITEDITLEAITDLTSMAWLTGPRADSFVMEATGYKPVSNRSGRGLANGKQIQVAVREDSRSRSIYLVFKRSDAKLVWSLLTEQAARQGARIVGSTALDTFRISRGIVSYGRELSDAFNPYEAGLREVISFTKGCYIGQEVVARLDTYQKIRRKLIGVVFSSRGTPGPPLQSLLKSGKEIGLLTSIAPSSVNGRIFGLGIVTEADVAPGDELTASVSGMQSIVTEFPMR